MEQQEEKNGLQPEEKRDEANVEKAEIPETSEEKKTEQETPAEENEVKTEDSASEEAQKNESEVSESSQENSETDKSADDASEKEQQTGSSDETAKPTAKEESAEETGETETTKIEKQEEPPDDSKTEEEAKEETKEDTEKEEKTDTEKDKTEAEKTEEPKAEEKPEEKKKKESAPDKTEQAYEELKEMMAKQEPIEVKAVKRIRGGLRVAYKEARMFLPTSHYTLKRNPNDNEMKNAVGAKFPVLVHEYQEYPEGRKAVIVSRKKILFDEIFNKYDTGDIIKGKVSSITSFGVFLEFEGVEGLIHISRLSKVHIDDPKRFYNKGEEIEAKIIDIDKENQRIALSREELVESPWKGVEEELEVGAEVKGIVRRLTNFGAYVELKPGVDGLLRNNEIHWTKRVKNPAEILSPNQEITVKIMSISEDNETAALSYKRTQPNPWEDIKNEFQPEKVFDGKVKQVIPQGAIVEITEEVDGFMPRSKMRPIMKGKKIPFKAGDDLEVKVIEVEPEDESLILGPNVDEDLQADSPPPRSGGGKKGGGKAKPDSSFTLGDILSEKEKERLKNMSD